MNNNSFSLIFSLAAVLVAPVAVAANLTINGEIVASTCTVTGKNGDVTIKMPKLDAASLAGNSKSTPAPLNITLACSGAAGKQNVAVQFSGKANAEGDLAITGTATNVGYRIEDADGKQLKINQAPAAFVTVDADRDYTLSHTIWYSKVAAGAATAGTAIATAQMDVVYK